MASEWERMLANQDKILKNQSQLGKDNAALNAEQAAQQQRADQQAADSAARQQAYAQQLADQQAAHHRQQMQALDTVNRAQFAQWRQTPEGQHFQKWVSATAQYKAELRRFQESFDGCCGADRSDIRGVLGTLTRTVQERMSVTEVTRTRVRSYALSIIIPLAVYLVTVMVAGGAGLAIFGFIVAALVAAIGCGVVRSHVSDATAQKVESALREAGSEERGLSALIVWYNYLFGEGRTTKHQLLESLLYGSYSIVPREQPLVPGGLERHFAKIDDIIENAPLTYPSPAQLPTLRLPASVGPDSAPHGTRAQAALQVYEDARVKESAR